MNIEKFPIQPQVEKTPTNFEKFGQSEELALNQAVAESENQAEARDLANVLELLTKKAQEINLSAEQKARFQQTV